MASWKSASDAMQRFDVKEKDNNLANNTHHIKKLKSSYEANQKDLRLQIRTISAKARTYKVAETQTDIDYDVQLGSEYLDEWNDSIGTDSKAIQKRFGQLLSSNRRLISKNEMLEEKMKFLEERLHFRIKNDMESVRREDERDLELMAQKHREQLRALEKLHKTEIDKKDSMVRRLQLEMEELNERLDDCEKETRLAKGDLVKLRAENRILSNDNKALNRNIDLVKLDYCKHYKDAAYIESLQNKFAESELTKKVVVENFCELEKERDHLAAVLDSNIDKIRKMNEAKSLALVDSINEYEARLEKYNLC